MQKITSYLYPNRIQLTTDLAVHPTEWRIVYQRKFKIYKGLHNQLLLDFKNAEQKRINVSDKTVKFVVMDQLDQEIYTTTAVHSATPGLATVDIPASAVSYIAPQFLKYSVYIENLNGTLSPVYGDTQFGVTGTFDLLSHAVPTSLPVLIIDTFNYMVDDSVEPYVTTFYSEAVEINQPNDRSSVQSVSLEFFFVNFAGNIDVQFTEDVVVSTATEWRTVESFAVTTATTSITKSYTGEDYSNNLVWGRVKYQLATGNTGTIDRILIRR